MILAPDVSIVLDDAGGSVAAASGRFVAVAPTDQRVVELTPLLTEASTHLRDVLRAEANDDVPALR
jgi:hypothetical protein